MSFKIGQFREDMRNDYLTQITPFSSKKILTTSSNTVGSMKFNDFILFINEGFNYQKSYYISFYIPRSSLEQTFTISLGNVDDEDQISTEQYLKTFYIPAYQNNYQGNNENINKRIFFEIVFNSNINFNSIIIKLNRTFEDYQLLQEDGTIGRIFSIENPQCYEIKNIISNLTGVTQIEKLGVQAKPGLLMCINGEEIRVGPSGIYEIKNGYKVTFIGFVIKDTSATNNYFILDYQYERR